MPILITVFVSSPDSTLASYDKIKIFRSNFEDGYFTEISTAITRPSIVSTAKYYTFEDENGTSSSWYKTNYFNSSTLAESAISTASQGIEREEEYVNPSYPVEITLTSSDEYYVDLIRTYIGDPRVIKRDYVSSTAGSYDNVSADGLTYKLSDGRGWPTRVIKDSVEYTSTSNPQVHDYQFLTFSGTTISTASGVVDVWYENFRHSDREILKIYNDTPLPPYVTTVNATTEIYLLNAAIMLLQQEITQLMGETSGKFDLKGELSYDPEGLLKQKKSMIDSLRGKLKEVTDEAVTGSISGVRID